MARSLIQAGIERTSSVVLLGDTDPEIMTAFFACQYASLIPVIVPIPASLGGRDAYVASLRRLLDSSRAKVAMAPEAYLGFLQEAVTDLSDAPMIGTPSAFAALPGQAVDPRPFGPDDPCYFQYSSGSTRWPLGVDVPQRCLMANAHAISTAGLDIRGDDRGVSWLPLYHDMGLVGFMLVPLMCQLSTDYLATRDFARRSLSWLQLFNDNGGTLAYSPTFGFDLCCRRAANSSSLNLDLSSWRAAGIGGDMIQPQVMERFVDVFEPHGFKRTSFVASYGMAEATLAVSFAPSEEGPGGRRDRPQPARERACGRRRCRRRQCRRPTRLRFLRTAASGPCDRDPGARTLRCCLIAMSDGSSSRDQALRPAISASLRLRPRSSGMAGSTPATLVIWSKRRSGDHRAQQGSDDHQRPQYLAPGRRMGGGNIAGPSPWRRCRVLDRRRRSRPAGGRSGAVPATGSRGARPASTRCQGDRHTNCSG